MAKKRRITKTIPGAATAPAEPSQNLATVAIGLSGSVARFGVACVFISAMLIPCDSIAVEQGHATYFSLLAILTFVAAIVSWPLGPRKGREIEVAFALLVLWIGIAAVLMIGRGNVRYALNEFWVWAGFLFVFAAARRTVITAIHKRALVALLLATLSSLAIHTVYQKYISFPETIRQYERDPAGSLAAAGIDAPEGSAVRFQYIGRLYESEASATYSLSTSAAIILLLGFVSSVVMLLDRQDERNLAVIATLILVAGLSCVGILMTGSRIATALMVALGALAVCNRWQPRRFALLGIAYRNAFRFSIPLAISMITGVTLSGAIITTVPDALALFERSLQFRFNYWASSLQMLADHPWIGAGPGNFQAKYGVYKSATLSEMIADPHNLLLETATSSGLLGGLLLLVIVGLLVRRWQRCASDGGEHAEGDDQPPRSEAPSSALAMFAGGIAAVLGVWGLGSMFGVAPELEPYLVAMPVACAIAFVFSRSNASPQVVAGAIVLGCFAVAIGLLFSGGITTPGIAAVIWCLFGAMLTPSVRAERADDLRFCGIAGFAGLLLLVAFCVSTLNPTTKAMALTQLASERFAAGDRQSATQLMQQAAQADSWDATTVKQLANVLTHLRTTTMDSSGLIQQWQATLEQIIRRDPSNPRAWQQVGNEYMTIYQRHGNKQDLVDARNAYLIAGKLDPTSTQLAAQIAVAMVAAGDHEQSRAYWSIAEELAEINDNTESKWDLLSVLPAITVSAAAQVPVTITIAEAWANRTEADRVEQN